VASKRTRIRGCAHRRWAISKVSALKLFVGARDQRELGNIDAFLSGYVVVPLRESTGKKG
jgi:hypothetical protein